MTDQNTEKYYDYPKAVSVTVEETGRRLESVPPVIRRFTGHLSKTRGKFIRARALLACAVCDGGKIPAEAVTMASAVELLHLATLVHDDVIDNADVRRGSMTLQKKFGKKSAVICGDYLLSMALKMAPEIPDKERYHSLKLPDYVGRLCAGELCQEVNNGNLSLSLYRYLSIIRGKTASLFEASFYAGGALAEENHKKLRLYRHMGSYTGMVFQLADDCIDYEMTLQKAGKTVRSDFDQGVITLPLIYTLRRDPGLQEQLLSGRLPTRQLYSLVAQAGGLEFTRDLAEKYRRKSLEALNGLMLGKQKEQLVLSVLDTAYSALRRADKG